MNDLSSGSNKRDKVPSSKSSLSSKSSNKACFKSSLGGRKREEEHKVENSLKMG